MPMGMPGGMKYIMNQGRGPPRMQGGMMPMSMQPGMPMGQQTNPMDTSMVTMNLCQDHFPEPIMMFKDKPLCKKCISEQFAGQMARQGAKSNPNQAMSFAKEIAANEH